MDSLIMAAARALATGDPLRALKRVALRDDAPALALRGIAMAQLGDLARAKALLKTAARTFGPKDVVARARCVVAEAEIALVSRDLASVPDMLSTAHATLEKHGDHMNAAHAANLEARRLLLIGRLDEAGRVLADLDPAKLPPSLQATYNLTVAGIAIRCLRTSIARGALARAEAAARAAGIATLREEVHSAALLLNRPAARLFERGNQRLVLLEHVEALFASDVLVVDACRYVVRSGELTLPLTTRPILFSLVRALAEASPNDVSRDELVAKVFRARRADESHRARLRVEIARLRAEIRMLAEVSATGSGFALLPRRARGVVVLAPPVEERHAAVLAFLADGESWPSSALAIALGISPRTVQRALEELRAADKVRSIGQGRARRWMTPPVIDFPTTLLLPGSLPEH